MSAPDRLVVLTPWYPNLNNPFAGAFVQAQVEALHPLIPRIDVVHTSDWATPASGLASKIVVSAFTRLVSGPGRRIDVVPQGYTEGVRVTRIPTMVTPARDYADWSRTHERTARDALAGRILDDAPLIHGHVGSYGGWVARALGRSDARIVVTEHASFLNRIFAQPEARQMYGQVLARADVITVVSNVLGRVVAGVFPQYVPKMVRIGNIVHVDRFPVRTEPVTDLRRWLYVGGFTQHKGVRQVLEAFAVTALERGDIELTMVGHGPLEDDLRRRAQGLGLASRVHFVPSMAPERIPAVMAAHDLLVHNSVYETFGLTVAEAVAAGTPVLVTRCGGPEETLEGIGPQAGELIEVSDGVLELLAGYRRLSARLDELDPVAARASIEGRFGPKAVASMFMAAYDGTLDFSEQGITA